MNIILTNPLANQLESEYEALRPAPAQIEQCVTIFEQCMKQPDFAEWIAGTTAAQSAATRLRKNCENMRQLANLCRRIGDECQNIVSHSRANNNQSM
jgi:hypothetical protein